MQQENDDVEDIYVSEGDAEAKAPATSSAKAGVPAHAETDGEEEEAVPQGTVVGSAPNGGQVPAATAAA